MRLLRLCVAGCTVPTTPPDEPTPAVDTGSEPSESCGYAIIETTRADPILRGESADDLIAELSLVTTVSGGIPVSCSNGAGGS